MHRTSLAAASMAAAFVMAPTADASAPRHHELVTYSSLYHAVAKHHGARVPGRNIRRQGVNLGHGKSRSATAAEVGRSIRTFRRWLAPPAPRAMPGDSTSSNPVYAGGRWAIPSYIVMCESGGDYTAQNPSGAGGAYQIMPGTWEANGGSPLGHGQTPASKSPAEQDRVAATIYARSGAGPWVCG